MSSSRFLQRFRRREADVEIIEELARLNSKASPDRVWEYDADVQKLVSLKADGSGDGELVANSVLATDAALIAAMRNALPRLLQLARDSLRDPLSNLKAIESSAEHGLTATRALLAQGNAEADRDVLSEKLGAANDAVRDAVDQRNRYLAALKAEAIRMCGNYLDYAPIDTEGVDTQTVGGITFRVTRNPDTGELVAAEVVE